MLQIISIFIGILVLSIGEVIFAKIVLNKKLETNKIQTLLILISSTAFFVLSTNYLTGIVKTILVYIIHIFEFKLLFNLSYYKSIFLTFLLFVVVIIPDILELIFVVDILGIDKTYFYNELAGSMIGNLTVGILLIIVTLILKKPLRKIINTQVSNNAKIVTLSSLTLLCIGIFFYIFIKEFKVNGNIIPYLIVIAGLVVILFSLFKQIIENNRLTQEYDQLLEFMITYEKEIEKQRILRHETKNEILSIRAKICDKAKNAEIIEFIDEILNEKIVVKQEIYAKFQHLPANGIKGLCYFKIQEAENRGIKISMNISPKIKQTTIYKLNNKQRRDFGKILGVFLDNAIEASTESEEKQLGIEAYATMEKEFKLIITNTFNNAIEKEKIGKEKFSSKGRDRGHGLLLVKHIIDTNNIFKTETEIKNNLYIQTVYIKNIIQKR